MKELSRWLRTLQHKPLNREPQMTHGFTKQRVELVQTNQGGQRLAEIQVRHHQYGLRSGVQSPYLRA
jgi:hypothetical protein